MKFLIVEDISKWSELISDRIEEMFGDDVKIIIAENMNQVEKVLASGQTFTAIALDGWLDTKEKVSTIHMVTDLLVITKILVSTSQNVEMRKQAIRAGCHAGGNKWDFVPNVLRLM